MNRLDRRDFLGLLAACGAGAALQSPLFGAADPNRPNVILLMADDLGWGDVGYNGHPAIQTPNLDDMSRTGFRFDRFYTASPVCSPTRGSCLTGRHPERYGIIGANEGFLPQNELTLAEALKPLGYRTGHFGKWHLGVMSTEVVEGNRGGREGSEKIFSPPWLHGFDVCFSTEAKVPTYDPMVTPDGWKDKKLKPGGPFGTNYWNEKGEIVHDNLAGDDSRVILDRAIPFIRDAAHAKEPFFSVIWLHSPHAPVVAGPDRLAQYRDQEAARAHYYGTISALDEQVGRLRKELRDLGIAEDTMLWFCSDNGPEPVVEVGSAGPFRGAKRTLYEGGVRVPGLLEWPRRFAQPRTINAACSTLDYFPTILNALNIKPQEMPDVLDGENVLPILEGHRDRREHALCFEHLGRLALTEHQFKIVRPDKEAGFELYDLLADPAEKNDLASNDPDRLKTMIDQLESWRASCRKSLAALNL